MAISYVGVSNLIATNGGAPGAITPAAATQAGDLMIFYHYSRATGGDETVTVPSGFTEFYNSTVNSGGLLVIGYRFEQAGDTTFTSTITNHTSGTTGETVLQWIESYRGADTSSPIKATASSSAWGSSLNVGPISAPTSATISPTEMVVVVGGRFENITAQTTLTGDSLTWTARTLNDTTLGSDAAAVTQNGYNGTSGNLTVTSKTITTTGTAQLGTGTMFIIRDVVNQVISEPIGSGIKVETTRNVTNATGTVLDYNLSTGTIAGGTAQVGDLEIFFITVDGPSPPYPRAQSNNDGLNYLTQETFGVDVSGAVYWRIRTGSGSGSADNLTFSTLDNVLNGQAVTEGYTHIKIAVSGYNEVNPFAGVLDANGNSTNADAPLLTLSEAKNYLWLAYAGWDNIITPSAAPSNYTMLTIPAATNAGASTAVAYRTLNALSENPGVFTSATEQWIASTIAVNPKDFDLQTAVVLKSVTITEATSALDTNDATVGGGNQVSGSVSESASATDLTDNTLQSTRTISETASANDLTDETLTTSSSVSENVTATDSSSGTGVTPVSVSEPASATDLTDETLQSARTISESVTATDLTDETLQATKAVSESGAATDLTDKTIQTSSSIAESASGSDSIVGTIVLPVSISETTTSSDSTNSTRTLGGSVTETGAASETINNTRSTSSSVTEAASASDLTDETTQSSRSISEPATASDLTNRSTVFSASLSEAASGADSLSSTRLSALTISEPASATDTQNFSGAAISASISESTTSLDSASCTLSTSKSISEANNASDAISTNITTSVVVTESANSSDSTNAVQVFYSSVSESGVATDSLISFAQFSSLISESSSIIDACDGGYKGLFEFKSFYLHTIDVDQSIGFMHTLYQDPVSLGNHKINT